MKTKTKFQSNLIESLKLLVLVTIGIIFGKVFDIIWVAFICFTLFILILDHRIDEFKFSNIYDNLSFKMLAIISYSMIYLLGEKIIMTEFIGYISLADMKEAGAFTYEKSIIMGTYMLCGFANFASIGIQIGGIGSLAPGKRVLLSQFGFKALLAGTLASLLSATIVGMILG